MPEGSRQYVVGGKGALLLGVCVIDGQGERGWIIITTTLDWDFILWHILGMCQAASPPIDICVL